MRKVHKVEPMPLPVGPFKLFERFEPHDTFVILYFDSHPILMIAAPNDNCMFFWALLLLRFDSLGHTRDLIVSVQDVDGLPPL